MPDEIGELKERAEEAVHEPSLAPVTLSMAILAVLIAGVTLLGHRAHTRKFFCKRARPISGLITRPRKSAAAATNCFSMSFPFFAAESAAGGSR